MKSVLDIRNLNMLISAGVVMLGIPKIPMYRTRIIVAPIGIILYNIYFAVATRPYVRCSQRIMLIIIACHKKRGIARADFRHFHNRAETAIRLRERAFRA